MFGMEYRFVKTEMTILSKVLGARVHIRLIKQIMGINLGISITVTLNRWRPFYTGFTIP